MKFVSSLREKRHKATSPIASAKKFMPLSERHFPGNCRQRKCQNLTLSVWQQFVEPYDALRVAKNAICRFTFREYRLPRVKINLGLAI
jgi:hypothetical protein